MKDKIVKCHFTLEELEYIVQIMSREETLSKYLAKQLDGLQVIGICMTYAKRPNITGKLFSYIKKAGDEDE